MKKLILLPIVFLICLVSVLSIGYYCGDGICTIEDSYDESDESMRATYCAIDCVTEEPYCTEEWCATEYLMIGLGDDTALRDYCNDTLGMVDGEDCIDCPTCPTCTYYGTTSTGDLCTTDRISSSELSNWCMSNGYVQSYNFYAEEDSSSTIEVTFWVIFLIIGFVIGFGLCYLIKDKRCKRKR